MLYAGANVNDTQRPPFAIVLNRQAGRGLALRQWPELQRALQQHGLTYQVVNAASGAQALRAVQSLPDGVPVMTVGGDGTVGAILPALVNSGRPLAVIPLGSGNDFAGMLGLKPGGFHEALKRLNYAPRAVDVLQVHVLKGDRAGERRALLNGLGMGFDAQVNQAMLRAPARLPGLARYAWGALASVRDLKLTPVTINVDGRQVYQGESCLCAVMNGTRYGGGFLISPRSDARDGLLNVVNSGPINRPELIRLMVQVLRGVHLGQPKVYETAGRKVNVTWDEPIAFHMDGDRSGMVQEITVELLPGAVQLLNG